jgi:2-amino-4-hydroxy-6-hydroxymethyldihydropteridine diphosphokinase
MNAAYLLIGGNLGNRLAFLDAAQEKMKQKGILLLRKSSVYETAAWGNTNQPSFLNQVFEISTSMDAEKLMHVLLSIEKELGRIRTEKNGARTIDIDILYFGEKIIIRPGLQIPHERIAMRKFVLIPLTELIPDFVDPSTGKTVRKMLDECPDSLAVTIYRNP